MRHIKLHDYLQLLNFKTILITIFKNIDIGTYIHSYIYIKIKMIIFIYKN